jgi:hypothetical protein
MTVRINIRFIIVIAVDAIHGRGKWIFIQHDSKFF